MDGGGVRNAGPHGQHEAGHVGRIQGHIARHFGAGAHQAHIALEDIDQLDQLVELPATDQRPDPGDARVGADGDLAGLGGLPLGHAAQLVDAEGLAVAPDALLAEEYRPRAVQLDGDGHQQEQRREQQQPQGGTDQVECPLDHGASSSRTVRITLSTCAWLMREYSGRLTMASKAACECGNMPGVSW